MTPTILLARIQRGLRRTAALGALLAAGALAAAPAHAQGGPIPPRDLGAIDQQLQSILQFAPPGSPDSFSAPSGANVSVRSFQAVERRTSQPCITCANPCRGYEVTYSGPAERVVMQGFRCRRSDGVWVMVQPETIISREATGTGPVIGEAGDIPEMSEDELRRRGLIPGEPGAEIETGELGPPSGPQPLTPEEQQAAADAQRAFEEGALPEADGIGAVPEAVEEGQLPGDPTQTAGTGPDGQPAGTPATQTAAAAPDGQAVIGGTSTTPVDAPPARELTEEDTVSRVIYPGGGGGEEAQPQPQETQTASAGATDAGMDAALSDPAVVSRLKQLRYLPQSASASDQEQVRRAVGAFAVDEQFALPIDASALATRLDAAADRNASIASCSDAAAADTICAEGQ